MNKAVFRRIVLGPRPYLKYIYLFIYCAPQAFFVILGLSVVIKDQNTHLRNPIILYTYLAILFFSYNSVCTYLAIINRYAVHKIYSSLAETSKEKIIRSLATQEGFKLPISNTQLFRFNYTNGKWAPDYQVNAAINPESFLLNIQPISTRLPLSHLFFPWRTARLRTKVLAHLLNGIERENTPIFS